MSTLRRRVAYVVAAAAFAGVVLPLASADGGSAVYLHGGAVEAGSLRVYAIFWESHAADWAYDNYITRFLNDVGGSSLMGTLGEYKGPGIDGTAAGVPGPAIHLAGIWHDSTSPLPTGAVGSQGVYQAVVNELNRVTTLRRWSARPGTVFMIFTGPGYQANSSICGWHSSGTDSQSGKQVPFAFVPRPGLTLSVIGCSVASFFDTPSGSVRQDSGVNSAWHELAEMLSDPVPVTGYATSAGAKGEIGDLCEGQYPGVTGSDHHDVVLNGHEYLVQGIWSNLARGCVVAPAPPPVAWQSFDFDTAPSTATVFSVLTGAKGSTLEVTDAYCPGDRFAVYDNGTLIGTTSDVPTSPGCDGPDWTDSATTAFKDPAFSHGVFQLAPGSHEIEIDVTQNADDSDAVGSAFYGYTGAVPTSRPSVVVTGPLGRNGGPVGRGPARAR